MARAPELTDGFASKILVLRLQKGKNDLREKQVLLAGHLFVRLERSRRFRLKDIQELQVCQTFQSFGTY